MGIGIGIGARVPLPPMQHHGACASGGPHSAALGRDVIAAGGNAVDAAVAAGLMACFTLPTMTGLGGAGLMTIGRGDDVILIDGFANLPGLDGPGERPPLEEVIVHFEGVAQTFFVGPASVATPGTVALLWHAHERFGRMPIAKLAGPVIRAAREGVAVSDGQYRAFALLETIFRRTPESWSLLGDDESLLQPDTLMRNAALADTLELLVAEGPRAFYEGDVAARLVEGAEGLLTHRDLRTYGVVERRPLVGGYRGWPLYVPAVPSFTGALLLRALAHLEAGPPLESPMEPEDWARIVSALRDTAALRTEDFDARVFEDGFLERVVSTCPGGSTMHISTIDDEGMVVSYTTTLGESAGIVAPGTGVSLNNFLGELDIHSPEAARPPGERMTTGMCPTLARDPEGRWMAVGSAGSARIRSAILQVLVRTIDGGVSLPNAIGRSRVHVEGDTLYVEGYGRSEEEVEALRPLAPELVATWAAGFFFGGAQAVRQTADGFEAGAEVARRGCAGHVV